MYILQGGTLSERLYTLTAKLVEQRLATDLRFGGMFNDVCVCHIFNKKHLKNVGPIRQCQPPHALIVHCHSPGIATVARCLRIDVHDDNDNNDNA